jgi:ABC-type glycerol-3-phosphate transport system substrate-binding protein
MGKKANTRAAIASTLAILATTAITLGSCGLWNTGVAVLWTDQAEFAFYAEQFNTAQDRYKVETHYFESPAQKLTEGGEHPDIVAASWLKSASTRALFRPLDNLFDDAPLGGSDPLGNATQGGNAAFGGAGALSRGDFYPRLLALGSIDGKQYLLPVAFNIPAIVFAREYSQLLSNPFTIGLEEIMERGAAYNAETNGVYTRMGFSPSWNDEFLFITATLFNTGFRESNPIAWDPPALEQAMAYIRRWITEANTSIQAEDDFAFKYLYDPPEKLVTSGRILFTYMDSSEFFILAGESRNNLDFRWIAQREVIPLDEWNVYFGIHKKAGERKAAIAFTRWFFNADTQRHLLETAKTKRLMETSFGIGGGFSAMRNVTEQIFPLFYPSLLGHMPPETYLSPSSILPRNWMTVKDRVILPYLPARIRRAAADELRPLDRRITDWSRLNRE